MSRRRSLASGGDDPCTKHALDVVASRIAKPERDYLKDRDWEELGPLADPILGLGQPSASRSREPRRAATIIVQSGPRRVRLPASGPEWTLDTTIFEMWLVL